MVDFLRVGGQLLGLGRVAIFFYGRGIVFELFRFCDAVVNVLVLELLLEELAKIVAKAFLSVRLPFQR